MSFTTGPNVKDLNATAAWWNRIFATQAHWLAGQFDYSQRGANAEGRLSRHASQPDRYAKELKAFYYSNGIRFVKRQPGGKGADLEQNWKSSILTANSLTIRPWHNLPTGILSALRRNWHGTNTMGTI
ncbi:hypothetical protein [Nitrospira sp. Nam80]